MFFARIALGEAIMRRTGLLLAICLTPALMYAQAIRPLMILPEDKESSVKVGIPEVAIGSPLIKQLRADFALQPDVLITRAP